MRIARAFCSVAGMALFAAGTASAAPVTIDFANRPDGYWPGNTVEQGYNFRWVGYGDYAVVKNVGSEAQPIMALVDGGPDNPIGAEDGITLPGDAPFRLISLDAANLSGGGWYYISVTASTTDGDWIQQHINPTGPTFTTYGASNGLDLIAGRELTWLSINLISDDARYAVTNITLDAVPEPASLGIGGMVAIGFLCRRKRRA